MLDRLAAMRSRRALSMGLSSFRQALLTERMRRELEQGRDILASHTEITGWLIEPRVRSSTSYQRWSDILAYRAWVLGIGWCRYKGDPDANANHRGLLNTPRLIAIASALLKPDPKQLLADSIISQGCGAMARELRVASPYMRFGRIRTHLQQDYATPPHDFT